MQYMYLLVIVCFFSLVVSKIVKIGANLLEYSFVWGIWASINSLETNKYLLFEMILLTFGVFLLECIYS